MVVARTALRASQADVEQLQCHAITNLEAGDAIAERCDLARALVTQHEARRHRKLASKEVQVAAADTDVADAHEDPTRPGFRRIDVTQLELAGLGQDCLFHAAAPITVRGQIPAAIMDS